MVILTQVMLVYILTVHDLRVRHVLCYWSKHVEYRSVVRLLENT